MNKLILFAPPSKALLSGAIGPHLARPFPPALVSARPSSSSSSSSGKVETPAICLSKDGTTFLAYHPQRDHPYEHTRPLPTPTEDDADASLSPLKVQIVKAFREKTTSKKLTNQDLGNMFGEPKNWFRPQPQERSRKEFADYKRMLKQKRMNELPEDLAKDLHRRS